jgi:hypothetical protein
MNWYAAHIIMYVRYKEHRQNSYPLWENVVLVRAGSADEAFAKAEKYGQAKEGEEDGSFSWSGKPARWVYGGVRKLTLCEDAEQRPGDGTEVTYTQMKVRSVRDLKKLLRGSPVEVCYIDDFQPACP